MDKKKNYQALKKYSLDQGVDLFGVAGINPIKHEFLLNKKVLAKVDKAISLGTRLSAGVLEEIEKHPTKLYYYHYKTLNALIDQTTIKIANFIQRKGFLAIPIPASQVVDWEKQQAHLSHRLIGVLAGVGWFGRNNLLVNKNIGCQFRLSTILTDIPLALDKSSKDNCAECRICVEACPAGAIGEKPEDFQVQKCSDKLKEFYKLKLADQYICGVCVNLCRGKKK